MSVEFECINYTERNRQEWENFVLNESCNGTFLQSRNFLNYHPKDKYIDCSLMFYDKQKLVAVCPACVEEKKGEKIFYSHAGSTYGGLVISADIMRAEKMLLLLDTFENSLKMNGFTSCILKQSNSLMCTEKMDLFEFCMYYRKYIEYKELDIYVDFEKLDKENVIGGFSKLKKRLTKKCMEAGMRIRELTDRDDIGRLLNILTENLNKYGLKPYHTLEDLLDLKKRFPEEIQFWGCEYEERIVAISMVFLFRQAGCVHTHYLAADSEYNKLSPMTFIYYKMIDLYKDKGYKSLSWGITTEHFGVEINSNLTNTKEEFGGRHNVVKIYEKKLQ